MAAACVEEDEFDAWHVRVKNGRRFLQESYSEMKMRWKRSKGNCFCFQNIRKPVTLL